MAAAEAHILVGDIDRGGVFTYRCRYRRFEGQKEKINSLGLSSTIPFAATRHCDYSRTIEMIEAEPKADASALFIYLPMSFGRDSVSLKRLRGKLPVSWPENEKPQRVALRIGVIRLPFISNSHRHSARA